MSTERIVIKDSTEWAALVDTDQIWKMIWWDHTTNECLMRNFPGKKVITWSKP